VRLLRPAPGARHNRYKYVMFLARHAPDAVGARLLDEFGIALGGTVYRSPCHQQRAFSGFASGPFPNADRLAATHICPPVYADMAPADASYVGEALRAVLGS
jgi:dTDP-4-amino-4,6-dideoxygalactose transaminase